MQSKKLLGHYHYGVILTYLSVVSAVVGICFSAVHHSWIGVICLLISGICDAFDGKVAKSRKNRTVEESKFGVQIDSLSDLIAFGALPAAIGFGMGMARWYYTPVFVVYTLCALIRLAHFNVSEELRTAAAENGAAPPRTEYEGLPVTCTAIAYPIFWMIASFFWHSERYHFIAGIIMAFGMLLLAVLFVLRFRTPKLRTRGMVIAIIIVAVLLAALLIVKGVCFDQVRPPKRHEMPFL